MLSQISCVKLFRAIFALTKLLNRTNMKNYKVKALVYSFCLAILLTLLCMLLNRQENDFVSLLLLFALVFLVSMVMIWNNKPLIHTFPKGHDDWLTPADRLICGILVIIVYISARYVWYYYQEDGSINLIAIILCLCAAFGYRTTYLNHAPDDIEQYEADRKRDEEVNSFVTVAECKDVESARIIKNLLESNGIEAATYGESYPEFLGNLPVRVIVRKKDQEAAEKLINE